MSAMIAQRDYRSSQSLCFPSAKEVWAARSTAVASGGEDVDLLVGSARIPCRRAQLANAAPNLKRLLETGEVCEGDQPISGREIRLPDGLHVKAVRTMVDFIGGGGMDGISDQDAVPVLRCAEVFGMGESVKEACVRCLGQSISRANCIQLRQVAAQFSSPRLAEQCDAFIEKYIGGLTSEDDFLALPRIQVNVDASSLLLEAAVDAAIMDRLLPSILKRLEAVTEKAGNQYLEEKVVRLVLPAQNGKNALPTRQFSPEKPPIVIKKNQPSPARKLLLGKNPLGENEAEAVWRMIASTKLSDLSAVCLVEKDSSLFVLSVLLSTDAEEGKPLPPSPTTGIPHTSSSALIAQMGMARSGFGLVATGENSVIAVGGFNRTGCHAKIERYTLSRNLWEDAGQMNYKRARFATAEVGGVAFFIGGCDGKRELASVESFDPSSQTCHRLNGSMPTPRSCFSAAVLEDKIYSIGGSRYSSLLRSVERFDPATQDWKILPAMKRSRSDLVTATCGGKIYAIGGQTVGWKCLADVECFDPLENSWKDVARMKTPRRNAAAVTVGDKIWVIGGYSGTKALKSVEIYDPQTDTWSPGPSMHSSRSSASAVTVGGTIYVIGGFSGSVFLNSVESCDLREWTAFV